MSVNGQVHNISFSGFSDEGCERKLKFSYPPRARGFLVNAGVEAVRVRLGREDRTALPISRVMNKNTMDSPLGQVFPNETAQLIKSSHHYRG